MTNHNSSYGACARVLCSNLESYDAIKHNLYQAHYPNGSPSICLQSTTLLWHPHLNCMFLCIIFYHFQTLMNALMIVMIVLAILIVQTQKEALFVSVDLASLAMVELLELDVLVCDNNVALASYSKCWHGELINLHVVS